MLLCGYVAATRRPPGGYHEAARSLRVAARRLPWDYLAATRRLPGGYKGGLLQEYYDAAMSLLWSYFTATRGALGGCQEATRRLLVGCSEFIMGLRGGYWRYPEATWRPLECY